MSEPVKDYPPYLDYPKPRKKRTNADKIRQMTEDELAHYFSEQPEVCPDRYGCSGKDCYDCWLDWLKQEVGENAAQT